MISRQARWALGGLLIASAFSLGLTKIQDTDAWTHLALGRAIVEAGGFPANEQFVVPSLGLPYYNAEWLFGVMLYLTYLAAGVAGVVLLKATLIGLAFLILFEDSLLPRDPPSHRALGLALAASALFPFVLAVRHRFVERPDLVLMVFLAFTIYALDAYLVAGRRFLYLLPLLQVLWVNMHPSIILAAVPFVAVLLAGGLQHLLRAWRGFELPGTPSARQLRVVAAVFVGVMLASLANPYGIDTFFAPFRLASSAWLMDEIVELQAPRWQEHALPFVVTGLLALGFAATAKRFSLRSLLLVAPFVYLGLSARRFMFLLAVVSAPILVRHLRWLASHLGAARAERLALPAALVAVVGITAGTGLTLARVEPFIEVNQVPGLGIHYEPLPEDALRYLDRQHLEGRVFNAFQWGGYIVWRDFPRRMPIVDGRGYLPVGLLDELQAARTLATRLESLQRRYGFDVAVLPYPRDSGLLRDETPDVDLGLTSPDWALVYWDDVAMVYVRRTEALAGLIERDEYREVKPANGALALRPMLADRHRLDGVEEELRRNIAQTGSSMALTLLGFVYNEVGSYDRAVEVLRRVRESSAPGLGLRFAYHALGFAHERLGHTDQAIAYYERAARLGDDPMIQYNLGTAYTKLGNVRQAIRHLERALELDRRLAPVYPALIAAYRSVGKTERAQELEAAYPSVLAYGQAEEHFRRGLRLYLERRHMEAIAEFKASIRVNPRSAGTRSNLGYVYFDLGLLDRAFAEHKAALDIDERFANAHYGLALIYLKTGERTRARGHLQEYLRLEPAGYWSRRAREEVNRLGGN